MAVESLQAWVLHKKPLGDTSLQVIFFTREKGIIYSIYKGGRASKKQPFLQPLTPLWISMDVRRQDKHYIRRIENTSSPLMMLNKHTLFSSFYMNELLYHSLRPLDAHEKLFDSYSKTLIDLSLVVGIPEIEALIRRFEKHLLKACGLIVSFEQAAYSEEAIRANDRYAFFANTGFVVSEEGPLLGKDILACGQEHLNVEDKDGLKAAKFIMRQAIDCLLEGKELKSRQLLYQLN